MDTIFRKTDSIFKLVGVARKEPHRYGKNGEQLVTYEETEEHQRRASYVSGEKTVANKDHSNGDYFLENGAGSSDSG
jgi:beta-xylosidase